MYDTAYEVGQKFFETYWKDGFRSILDAGQVKACGPIAEVLREYDNGA